MKNVPDNELLNTKKSKRKASLRMIIPIALLLIALSVVFVLHASGSFAIDADEINSSLVASDIYVTEPCLQGTEAPELFPEKGLEAAQVSEPIPITEPEPGEESKPDPTEEFIHQPETTPEADSELPTEHTHIFKDSIIAPTCSSNGYTLHECACGHSYTDNEQEMLPHTYTEQIISPTTEFQGYTLHSCSVCGYQYKDNYTDPVATPTDPPVEETQPTATDPEMEEEHPEEDYGFCPVCGRRLWTSWYPSGCFTYLQDTVCSCGQLVHAMQCHHH